MDRPCEPEDAQFAMKLLVMLAERFDYTASEPGSPLAAEQPEPAADSVESAIVAFVQCEPRDEERGEAVLKQAVKYFRWFARKRKTGVRVKGQSKPPQVPGGTRIPGDVYSVPIL